MSDESGPVLSVVIPSFNGRTHLQAFLSSTVQECAQLGEPTEILVVDNASGDDTLPYLQREHPTVRILALTSNAGYAGACDAGIRAAAGRFCLLLNNDARFEPHGLEVLLRYAMRGDYAIAGPTVLSPDGSFQSGPMAVDVLGDPPLLGGAGQLGRSPFYVSGAALLIRRSDYLALGGLDTRFFILFEETDLQWRAHLAGRRVGYAEDARVYHLGGGTAAGAILEEGKTTLVSRQRLYFARRNNLAMLLRNYSRRSLAWVLPLWCLSAAVECLGMAATGHAEQVRVYAAAVAWNAAHVRGTLRLRRATQATRVVSDETIRRLQAPPFTRVRTLVRLARSRSKVEIA